MIINKEEYREMIQNKTNNPVSDKELDKCYNLYILNKMNYYYCGLSTDETDEDETDESEILLVKSLRDSFKKIVIDNEENDPIFIKLVLNKLRYFYRVSEELDDTISVRNIIGAIEGFQKRNEVINGN